MLKQIENVIYNLKKPNKFFFFILWFANVAFIRLTTHVHLSSSFNLKYFQQRYYDLEKFSVIVLV